MAFYLIYYCSICREKLTINYTWYSNLRQIIF